MILVMTLVITGCANHLRIPEFKSGFLKDYRLFRPNPNTDNSWIRTKRGFKLSDFEKYDKVALSPIEIWLDPNEAANIVDKDKQQQLTSYFEQQIKATASDRFEFVEPGTKDSLLIRIALTNIKESTPDLSPLDIIPFRIVMKAGKEVYLLAAAKKAVIGAATLEVEFVDTNSNQGLVAVIVSNDTGEVNVSDDEHNIESVKLVVDGWVDKLAEALSKKN